MTRQIYFVDEGETFLQNMPIGNYKCFISFYICVCSERVLLKKTFSREGNNKKNNIEMQQNDERHKKKVPTDGQIKN